MSTTTIDPPTQVQSPAPAPRRRTGRWIVAGLVIALLISGVSYVATYQPLVRGNYRLGPVYENAKLPNLSPSHVVPYVEGAAMRWGFSIRNDGPFPVTVTDAEWGFEAGPLPHATFLISTADLSYARAIPGPLEPMHPFTLAPGQQRIIVLRGVMSGCTLPPSGAGQTTLSVDSLIIDSRAFGISHVTTILGFTDDGFQIALPANSVCS